MPALVFIDVIAVFGTSVAILALLWAGIALQSRATALHVLSLFVGKARADQCAQDGSFQPAQVRALGSLILVFTIFIALCLLRGIWSA